METIKLQRIFSLKKWSVIYKNIILIIWYEVTYEKKFGKNKDCWIHYFSMFWIFFFWMISLIIILIFLKAELGIFACRLIFVVNYFYGFQPLLLKNLTRWTILDPGFVFNTRKLIENSVSLSIKRKKYFIYYLTWLIKIFF